VGGPYAPERRDLEGHLAPLLSLHRNSEGGLA